MSKLVLMLSAALVLTGCDKTPTMAPGSSSGNANDPVDKKVMELAGQGATGCGHIKAQATAELDAAGKCVMQAAQQKKPFYVAYEMPGLTVAIAGNSEG